MPSRLASTFIGSGLVAAVANYDTFAIVFAGLAIAFEAVVFYSNGVG
jgi:hypothetical protein